MTSNMCTAKKGVATTLKKLRTSKGDYSIKKWFSSIAFLFKMETSLKGKNLLPEGANCFPIRAVPYCMENHFYHISDLPFMLLSFYAR